MIRTLVLAVGAVAVMGGCGTMPTTEPALLGKPESRADPMVQAQTASTITVYKAPT